MEGIVKYILMVGVTFISYVGEWKKAVYIKGTVSPEIVQVGQDVILCCQVGGCTSSRLQVHLYKWEDSKNQTLYIHNSTEQQQSIQESSTAENNTHKGYYENGFLEVTLLQVQLANGGQYVCSMVCDDVYKEDIVEVTVEGLISVTVGDDAILPCQMIETYHPSHLELQWRRRSPGKSRTIYSYQLYWDTCPSVCYGDKFVARCPYSNRPKSQVWLRKKYKLKAEVLKHNNLGDGNISLKLNNIQEEDAGKYECSMNSNLRHKVVIYKLAVREVPGQSAEVWKFCSFAFLAFLFVVSWRISRKLEQLKTENEKLKGEMKAKTEQYEAEKEQLEIDKEILAAHLHKADVILDPRTAHPKLKVSEDGKSVWNTGNVSKVSDWEERFDSHTFILAKRGFSEGKHYWEVELGQKKTWDLGVASATTSRKGETTLSPENGYWVIGCDDGKDYWARTEQWTHLKVNGKLKRLGIFLDKSAGSISFYDVCSKRKLHTFKTLGDKELFPFFYIGSVTEQPLKIV